MNNLGQNISFQKLVESGEEKFFRMCQRNRYVSCSIFVLAIMCFGTHMHQLHTENSTLSASLKAEQNSNRNLINLSAMNNELYSKQGNELERYKSLTSNIILSQVKNNYNHTPGSLLASYKEGKLEIKVIENLSKATQNKIISDIKTALNSDVTIEASENSIDGITTGVVFTITIPKLEN